MKKAAERKTELDRLAARLRTALRRDAKNNIEIGNILIEIRKHLQHGEWQPWLAENFDLSIRTAQNYLAAAEYVARKSETVADFGNLSPSVLYALAGGDYTAEEEAAILAATHEGRVDEDAASAICEALAPTDDDDAEDADDSGEDGGDDAAELPAAEDPEIAAMLDGPPPAVPPPAPPPPQPDFALREFDQAISTLKRLMTKPCVQFTTSAHDVNDLEHVQSFIDAVAKAKTG